MSGFQRIHLAIACVAVVAAAMGWASLRKVEWVPVLAASLVWLASIVVAQDLKHLRRRRRKQDGRCPDCGYDLRASNDRCPECGRAIDEGRN